jgi:hypothetical protein
MLINRPIRNADGRPKVTHIFTALKRNPLRYGLRGIAMSDHAIREGLAIASSESKTVESFEDVGVAPSGERTEMTIHAWGLARLPRSVFASPLLTISARSGSPIQTAPGCPGGLASIRRSPGGVRMVGGEKC